MEYEAGILGLWSGNSSHDEKKMVMPGLCADTHMKDCIFSFYLTGLSGLSYLDFGIIDSSIVKNPSESVWIDIQQSDLWRYTVTGFRWDPK